VRNFKSTSRKFALLAVAAIVLTACGESRSSNSAAGDSASTTTEVVRTKNKMVSTDQCTEIFIAELEAQGMGDACSVGSVGAGGGIIFFVNLKNFTSKGSACGSSCRYLEVAPKGWIVANNVLGLPNQSNCEIAGTSTRDPQCAWSESRTSWGNTTTDSRIGTGFTNTSTIINQFGNSGGAATVARTYRGGSKTDWFLPSADELIQLCRYAMGLSFDAKSRSCLRTQNSTRVSGFEDYYVSSTQYEDPAQTQYSMQEDRSKYFLLNVLGGKWGWGKKSFDSFVRPVRAF